jgi:hypothetical protein
VTVSKLRCPRPACRQAGTPRQSPEGLCRGTRTPLKLLEDQVSLIFQISCGTQPPLKLCGVGSDSIKLRRSLTFVEIDIIPKYQNPRGLPAEGGGSTNYFIHTLPDYCKATASYKKSAKLADHSTSCTHYIYIAST